MENDDLCAILCHILARVILNGRESRAVPLPRSPSPNLDGRLPLPPEFAFAALPRDQ